MKTQERKRWEGNRQKERKPQSQTREEKTKEKGMRDRKKVETRTRQFLQIRARNQRFVCDLVVCLVLPDQKNAHLIISHVLCDRNEEQNGEEEEEEDNDEDGTQVESSERKEHATDGQTGEENVQSDTAAELAGAACERDQAKEVSTVYSLVLQ